MKFRKRIEDIGYRVFLDYDVGIQYEFQREKEKKPDKPYYQKCLYLIWLIILRKVFRLSEYDNWCRKRNKVSFQTLDKRVKTFQHQILKARSSKHLYVDFWSVMAFPILGGVSETEDFVQAICSYPARNMDEDLRHHKVEEILLESEENRWMRDVLWNCKNDYNNVTMVCRDSMQIEWAMKYLWRRGWKKVPNFITLDQMRQISEPDMIYGVREDSATKGDQKTILAPSISDPSVIYHMFPEYSPVQKCYQTICDARILWTNEPDSRGYYYRIGFLYGGILALGICQWLNRLKHQLDLDQFVFLSRDCDIIYHLYQQMYSRETDVYLQISRRALAEALFQEDPYFFVENMFMPRMGYADNHISLHATLEDLELGFLEEKLSSVGLAPSMRLDYGCHDSLIKLMKDNYQECCLHYLPARKAAMKYFDGVFQKDKRICVVDLGWNGSTYRYLTWMKSLREWKSELYGALVVAKEGSDISNKIASGQVFTYLFSNERTTLFKGKWKEPYNNQQVRCIETIFSSPQDSLTNYELDDEGKVCFRRRDKNKNREIIQDIHAGIKAFSHVMIPILEKARMSISKEDAFLPMATFLSMKEEVIRFNHGLQS